MIIKSVFLHSVFSFHWFSKSEVYVTMEMCIRVATLQCYENKQPSEPVTRNQLYELHGAITSKRWFFLKYLLVGMGQPLL